MLPKPLIYNSDILAQKANLEFRKRLKRLDNARRVRTAASHLISGAVNAHHLEECAPNGSCGFIPARCPYVAEAKQLAAELRAFAKELENEG